MLSYVVTDIEKFLLLYDFDDKEEAEIQERFEAGEEELLVHQDGSVTWEQKRESEELVPPDEEMQDEDSFIKEAEKMGSSAVAFAGEDNELSDAEVSGEE